MQTIWKQQYFTNQPMVSYLLLNLAVIVQIKNKVYLLLCLHVGTVVCCTSSECRRLTSCREQPIITSLEKL